MSKFNISNPNSFSFANKFDDAGGKIQPQNNPSNSDKSSSQIVESKEAVPKEKEKDPKEDFPEDKKKDPKEDFPEDKKKDPKEDFPEDKKKGPEEAVPKDKK